MEPTQTSSQSTTSTVTSGTTPTQSSNWGCWLLGSLGCLGLLAVLGLLAGAIFFFVIERKDSAVGYSNDDYNYNYKDNDNYNTNTDLDTNWGYAITDEVSETERAYQIVAYPELSYSLWEYPSLEAAIPYTDIKPLTGEDHGHLWIGATLDNGYFIQVGMATSDTLDDNGNMVWNYFWEVWDDHGDYIYGYQDLMSSAGWDNNFENTFSLTCQDPAAGIWEFWVNDETVGTAETGDCAMNLQNASLAWELVTDKTSTDQLPEFGPFALGTMQYWDDYNWLEVPSATLVYGYGLIKDGTVSDQASVCPPYGVQAAVPGSRIFSAGSTLDCLETGVQLW